MDYTIELVTGKFEKTGAYHKLKSISNGKEKHYSLTKKLKKAYAIDEKVEFVSVVSSSDKGNYLLSYMPKSLYDINLLVESVKESNDKDLVEIKIKDSSKKLILSKSVLSESDIENLNEGDLSLRVRWEEKRFGINNKLFLPTINYLEVPNELNNVNFTVSTINNGLIYNGKIKLADGTTINACLNAKLLLPNPVRLSLVKGDVISVDTKLYEGTHWCQKINTNLFDQELNLYPDALTEVELKFIEVDDHKYWVFEYKNRKVRIFKDELIRHGIYSLDESTKISLNTYVNHEDKYINILVHSLSDESSPLKNEFYNLKPFQWVKGKGHDKTANLFYNKADIHFYKHSNIATYERPKGVHRTVLISSNLLSREKIYSLPSKYLLKAKLTNTETKDRRLKFKHAQCAELQVTKEISGKPLLQTRILKLKKDSNTTHPEYIFTQSGTDSTIFKDSNNLFEHIDLGEYRIEADIIVGKDKFTVVEINELLK